MQWTVAFTGKARKQKDKLPQRIRELLFQLARDIEATGPVRGDWPNYGKLGHGRHPCHLKKGRPTYVAVWIEDRGTVTVEIFECGSCSYVCPANLPLVQRFRVAKQVLRERVA